MSKSKAIKKIEKALKAPFPIMDRAKRLANRMYKDYYIEEKEGRECGKLLLDWTKEHFWGIVISKEIKTFNKVWNLLDEREYTKNNKLVFGDIDEGVWVEYPKNKDKKVIICTRYNSCAEDNTHIFVLDEPFKNQITFRVSTVWPKEIPYKGNIKWNDDRDVDTPSLNTYRKRDFKYGYSDGRDKGHSIMYETSYGRIGVAKDANWITDSRIKYALDALNYHLEVLNNEEEYKC